MGVLRGEEMSEERIGEEINDEEKGRKREKRKKEKKSNERWGLTDCVVPPKIKTFSL